MKLIELNLEKIYKIYKLCRKYKVKTLSVFGSILTDRFNDESDVDFSATFYPEEDPLVRGENFLNLYMDLGDLMGIRIYLVDEYNLRNPYFIEELEETKQLIYGKVS